MEELAVGSLRRTVKSVGKHPMPADAGRSFGRKLDVFFEGRMDMVDFLWDLVGAPTKHEHASRSGARAP
eukprot:6504814-Pyramimonas_sp.AAC.1